MLAAFLQLRPRTLFSQNNSQPCVIGRLRARTARHSLQSFGDEMLPSKFERQGTLAKDKNELLFQQFGINYNELPDIFRKGSCVYKDYAEETVKVDADGNPVKRRRERVVVGHFDIIGDGFWDEHPYILKED